MKKQVFVLLSLLYFFQSIQGQIKVKIGNDTTFCAANIEIGIELGSNLIVENAIPPLKYTWSAIIHVPWGNSEKLFPASDFLNDTTIANPKIKESWASVWNKFVLEVQDSRGYTAKDSIHVRFSQFKYPLGYDGVYLNPGDSVMLKTSTHNAFFGGIFPYISYRWSPEIYLSTPDQFETWCKPTQKSDIEYSISVIDSAGCISSYNTVSKVIMNTAAMEKIEKPKKIYQKGNFIYVGVNSNDKTSIRIFNINGVKLYDKTTTNSHLNLNELALANGVYICEAIVNGERLVCKILKSD
ncbi:MAG: T9SS type A sorting domain-containing protein [Dysgonamonadaceae bacterium]|jgi:hypothetical protein|nr:T9SS type A sorting domain-containing protein [Dysgonamonadaceae bacterium]